MPLKTDSSIEKWLSIEYRNINKNLVKKQIVLNELLDMEEPGCDTKADEVYIFNKSSLQAFALAIPEKYHRRLKLPIFFFKNSRVPDSCYMIDPVAVEALQETGDLNKLYRFRENKLWLALPLAYEIANKYPSLIQFIFH
jgi:uncharacterized protein (UPF0216 family)